MAQTTKIIRRRLRSINNTKKITKAMEMVAAVKMRKATMAALAARPYALAGWGMALRLVRKITLDQHPLLIQENKSKKVLLVLFSGNRGLCGGFNSRIVSQAILEVLERKNQGASEIDWVTVGRKGTEFLIRQRQKVIAEFEKPEIAEEITEILALTQMITQAYLAGDYGHVVLAYTDFISPLVQKPRIRQLLPFLFQPDLALGAVGEQNESGINLSQKTGEANFEFLLEQSQIQVLNQLLPRLIEIQLYQALLESSASEHSARMLAMKNASEAAVDLIEDLTLLYNQARQSNITREIAEISVGKAALESE